LDKLEGETFEDKVRFWIKRQINDPITKILLPNSNLTETQLKTLLLDFLSDGFSDKKLTYEEKAKLRNFKYRIIEGKRQKINSPKGISRGAFNRVLRQARNNVIKAIYTVILIGYLGIFEDPRLQQYISLAEEIKQYSHMYESTWESFLKEKLNPTELKFLKEIQRNLTRIIKKLAEPLSLKKVVD